MTDRIRRLFVLLLALGALLGALATGAVFSQRQARLRGALDGLPPIHLPPRPPILGVNVDLRQYDSQALAENLDLIAETGFVWVRQSFAWSDIESEPGAYAWSSYDTLVDEVNLRSLRLVAILEGSPSWAAPDPSSPPAQPGAFARFASALAERYGDKIDVYQVWDEPNLASGWGGHPANPVEYAVMLEAAYKAIHAVDAQALVLTAGLAPTLESGPQNLSDVLYLRGLYENGAADFFDGVAGKPYGFDTGPDDRRVSPDALNFSRFILLRDEMEQHGDGDKPLWASHFGWNALPEGWAGQPSLWGQTTPDIQAVWTLEAYQRALAEWPWSGALILDSWQPVASSGDPRWGFALRGSDSELSPTVEMIQAHAETFNTALWPGIYPVATSLANYSGEWEFSDLGADFGQQGNSAVDLPFVGNSLAVIIRRDNYRAYLYVAVDGQPSRILPQDERGAYLVLTSPDYQAHIEMLPVADGLAMNRKHLAHMEAERGWDQWALVGFAVGAEVDTRSDDLLAGCLALLALVLAGSAFRAGRGLQWQAAVKRLSDRLSSRLADALHLGLSLAASLAVWVGAALTWGGLLPDLTRRMGDGPSLLITALTAGLFYVSPWLLLTLAALVLLFLLIYARPSIGLALMMFFTPYYLLPRPLFDRAFSMVEVVSLLTLAAWAIRLVAEHQKKGWPSLGEFWRGISGLDKAVGLFVALSIVSLSWADLLGVAVTELRQMVLEPVVMYLVLRTTPLSERERWRIVDLLILTGAIVAVFGFYQFARDVVAIQGFVCLRSVFGTCNNAALYMGRLVPIAASIALIGGPGRRRWLYGLAGCLTILASVLTTSRGGLLLGLPAGVGLVVILWGGRKGALAVGAAVVLEALLVIPLARLFPRFDLLSKSSFSRIDLWQSTLRMLRDHPITGVGLDQFLYQYRGHYILPSAWEQPDLSQPHNVLLNYWVRLGIFGLAAGIWLQVAFWRLAWSTHSRLREMRTSARALAVGLMGSMAAFVAHGMVDEVHFVIDLAFIFFMSLGLMHQLNKDSVDGNQDQGAKATAG